jgi:hypothetical protein
MARGKAAKTKKRAWRKYSAEKREGVIAEVEELGLTKTAEKYGMPISTLFDWVNRAGAAKTGDRGVLTGATPAPAASSGGAKAAGLKKRVAKAYTPSQRALILEDAAKDGPTAAAEKHGCSRFSI